MCNAVVATFVLNAIEVVPHSVDVYSFTVESRLTVQVFDRLLNFERGDKRCRDAGGRNMALLNRIAREHGAGKTISNELSIGFIHRALVTGSTGRIENTHNSRQSFYGSINPRSFRTSTRSIHKHSRFTIVESANNNVGPQENSETKILHDVLCAADSDRLWIQFRHSLRGHLSFECTRICFLKEDCPAEIADLDPVHAKNHDVAHATESQQFKNLISQRARADYEDARRRQTILLPPRNQTLAVVAVFG